MRLKKMEVGGEGGREKEQLIICEIFLILRIIQINQNIKKYKDGINNEILYINSWNSFYISIHTRIIL